MHELAANQRIDRPHRPLGPASMAPLEAGRMWVDQEYLPHLKRAGLSSFESVMKSRSGRLLRTLSDRENWRLELDRGQHGRLGMYLKKHRIRSWGHWLRAKLGAGPGATPGRVEALNVERLQRLGIAAMRLVAYGEWLRRDGVAESFVMTEELAGYVQLDHFLRQRFEPVEGRTALARHSRLDRLIAAVAAVAGRFHREGFNHRDLYCCHFFIREASRGRFLVHLIDLQRVQRRRWLRRRWIVKDLAQLAYSAPRERLTRTHRLAFIKHYLGVSKLRPADKRLVRQVLAKQRSMERRLGAHP
ncbi:MAG TPA: lipopolysaccharide kinase InaA family protein [Pirellulales bacterium]|jgi:heptose I phosphotransferase|nr:lipopolysaccharide kinase InaA family protein [Pirellulales bacterium]